jgi:hypothetical protein
MLRFTDGLIAEDRQLMDQFSLMDQLGLLPQPA